MRTAVRHCRSLRPRGCRSSSPPGFRFESSQSAFASVPPASSASWPSPSTVHYAAAMSIERVPGKGRGSIARQDIAAGDVMLVEEPVCTLLHSSLPTAGQAQSLHESHCAYCLAPLSTLPATSVSSCGSCDARYCSDRHRQLHDAAFHSVLCGYVPPSCLPSVLDDDVTPAPLLKFPILAAHVLTQTLIQMLTPAATAAAEQSASLRSPLPALWSDIGRLAHAELDDAALAADHADLLSHLLLNHHRHPVLRSCSLSRASLAALLPLPLYSRTVGLLHLNCHSLYSAPDSSSTLATALFAQASLFNHSCSPNVALQQPLQQALRTDGRRVGVWKAARSVAAGEELTNAYTDCDAPVKTRRSFLKWAYGFDCHCDKCRAELTAQADPLPPYTE